MRSRCEDAADEWRGAERELTSQNRRRQNGDNAVSAVRWPGQQAGGRHRGRRGRPASLPHAQPESKTYSNLERQSFCHPAFCKIHVTSHDGRMGHRPAVEVLWAANRGESTGDAASDTAVAATGVARTTAARCIGDDERSSCGVLGKWLKVRIVLGCHMFCYTGVLR